MLARYAAVAATSAGVGVYLGSEKKGSIEAIRTKAFNLFGLGPKPTNTKDPIAVLDAIVALTRDTPESCALDII